MKSSRTFYSLTFFLAVFSLSALAQQPAPPSIPLTGFPGLDQYRASRIAIFTDDFGQLARYREANAALNLPKGENRVVFFGDSITDSWHLDYFSAMVDDKGLLKKDLADDGLHPNAAGFKIMAPMAEAAIEKALK